MGAYGRQVEPWPCLQRTPRRGIGKAVRREAGMESGVATELVATGWQHKEAGTISQVLEAGVKAGPAFILRRRGAALPVKEEN